jgi:DNA-binding CsgD family transcriptional regulator
MGDAAAIRARVRDDVIRIVHRGLGLEDLTRSVGRSLGRAVPFDGICLLTVDPATLLPTGEVVENGLPPAAMVRLTEIELTEPDVNKFTTLARSAIPAASLSQATDGDLDRSLRQRELRRPSGFADELRSVLTDATGSWGALTLLRETGRPHFTPTDVRFVGSLAPILAEGVRRMALMGDATGDSDRSDTGFLVLGFDDTVELANSAGEDWIDELSPSEPPTGALPTAVRGVAAQARRVAAGDRDVLASARVRTRAGQWVIVRGSPVGAGQVAVLLEAARPAELAAAIADAYAHTERERAITALVARGLATAEIAHRLHLSAYTVQDHLKTIFDKCGTSSRGELVSRLFFDHHVARLAGAHHP